MNGTLFPVLHIYSSDYFLLSFRNCACVLFLIFLTQCFLKNNNKSNILLHMILNIYTNVTVTYKLLM